MPTTGSDVSVLSWRVLECSVQGFSHRRPDKATGKATECQDFSGVLAGDDAFGGGVAVSVADGHGSPASYRSAMGARLAVEISHELAEQLLRSKPTTRAERSIAKRSLELEVGRQIAHRWRVTVEKDLKGRPFSDNRLARIEARAGVHERKRVERDPLTAYGTTLVTAVATDSFMAFWHIGDGDIVTVDAQGHVTRPLPSDELAFANATPSLYSSDAAQHFRTRFMAVPAPLALVSTDGLANSFEDEVGFLKFAADIFERIASDGWDSIGGQLEGWLSRLSEGGSKDDIAVGILYRPQEPSPTELVARAQQGQESNRVVGLSRKEAPGQDDQHISHHRYDHRLHGQRGSHGGSF